MRQLLRNGAIVDVRTGRAIVDGAILVAGERIAAVGRSAEFGERPDGATLVELGGAIIVPGFVDPHVHVAFASEPDALERVSPNGWDVAARNARTLLESGVTTVADCGGPGELTLRLKQAIDHGEVAGPRLLVSLNPITTRSGHCNFFGALADDADSARSVARALIARGADFIKVMASGGGTRGATPATEPQFSQASLEAIVDEAHTAGLYVAAHARAPIAIRRAVLAGVDRIEHMTFETDSGVAYDLEIVREMVARDTWADPTLPAGVRALDSEHVGLERRTELRQQFAWRYPNYRLLAGAGVRLLCGTDAGTPLVTFDDFALGPELLSRVVGYSPAEALTSATLWGAQALGLDDSRGSLEPGKLADLVVLEENPLDDPSAMRSVKRVMLGGHWQEH